MSYTACGHPIIDDSYARMKPEDGYGTGYIPRDYAEFPLAGLKCASVYSGPRLDLAEIKERIKEKTAKRSWVTDLCDQAGVIVKNQKQSSYCWIHAPTHGIEVNRCLQGDGNVRLSAFWAGSQIKGGANVGGSGIQGVHFLSTHGTPTEEMWPIMQFRGQSSNELLANAALHKIESYEDLNASDYQAIWTSIVLDQPVTVGIPAWGHEVLLTFLVVDDRGNIAEGFDNSWGQSWGKNGRGVLSGSMRRFDEAGRIMSSGSSIK